jgi:uncharacterized protein YjbI with pentapeptide repeats
MKYKFLTLACLIITSVLTSKLSLAQNQTNAQDLYELCSKFPLNSRCEGIKTPIPLKERDGKEVICKFTFDPGIFKQAQRHSVANLGFKQPGGCKLLTDGNILTIYQEQGEKIELLENKRSTSETKIKSDRIFISNYQVWNKIHRWEIGFVPENNIERANPTNFLVILLDKDTAESLAKKVNLLSSYNPELLNKKVANNAQTKSAALKRLLATNECKNCDLANANLENANLARASLEGANLTNANLKNANLQQATLKNTYMLGANLEQANLTQAELDGANLTLASLNKSILSDANLQGANLQKASLQQANLTRADLSAPSILQDANLANANLSNANLKGTNFKNANLRQASLKGADLSKTDIKLKDIPNNYSGGEQVADLLIGFPIFSLTSGGVDFSTSFLGANLEGANFSDTDLDKVSFENANLTNANFSNSNLDEDKLEDVKLCGVILADGSRSDRDCR